MIRQVEELRSELKSRLTVYRESLRNHHIDLGQTRTRHDISSGVAERADRVLDESIGIEPLPDWVDACRTGNIASKICPI